MQKNKQPGKISEVQKPLKHPLVEHDDIPENPLPPGDELDIIPEEDLFETPQEEKPPFGERP